MGPQAYRTHAKARLRYHGASRAALPRGPYRGGIRTETVGSWADIKVLVPGTQGEPSRGALSPQSARSDVGCAANATPMANTAAAAAVTFRRCIPRPSD